MGLILQTTRKVLSITGRGARGDPGIDHQTPIADRPGRFLQYGAGSTGRNVVAVTGATPANAVAATDLAADSGAALIGARLPAQAAVPQSLAEAYAERVSVTKFGAKLDGNTDDSAAFRAALATSSCVVVPPSLSAAVLGSTVPIPQSCSLVFEGSRGQVVAKTFDGDLFPLASAARLIGGDHRGGGHIGALVTFGPNTGQQHVEDFFAQSGWADTIIRYALTGGSQSLVAHANLARDNAPNNDPAPKFAMVVEDGPSTGATPRRAFDLDFNGTPSIAFGGSNSFYVNACYMADLQWSANSRAVHITGGGRVGNVTAVTILGSDHFFDVDCLARISIGPGADNVLARCSLNSGYIIDSSGNSRNTIDYWQHPVTVALASDDNPLAITTASCTIGRASAVYHFQFYFTLQNLGPGITYANLPVGAYTSCPVDQYGSGLMLYTDSSGVAQRKVVLLRVLPADGSGPAKRIELLTVDGPLAANNPAGATAITIVGHMEYIA